MSYHPECWRCDFCERIVQKEELKPVPVDMVCLFLDFCPECRQKTGWTDKACDEYLGKFRELVKQATERSAVQGPPSQD